MPLWTSDDIEAAIGVATEASDEIGALDVGRIAHCPFRADSLMGRSPKHFGSMVVTERQRER